jgi:pterin-4a-carbinolamine dehydratase
MSATIFISYRRVDSQHASLAIADRLRWAFGPDNVFLDHGSIRTGKAWPKVLADALREARVMVAVVGPNWLSATDEWGRRRIDDRGDWVRQELLTGLERLRAEELVVLPVFLDKAPLLAREALDAKLADFADLQRLQLSAASWERDLEALIEQVSRQGGLTRRQQEDRNPDGSPARPKPDLRGTPTLGDEQVREALQSLSRWHLRWTAHPWGASGEAQEIAKAYDFPSFEQAIGFMSFAAERLETWKPQHHPRWENQWKVVHVAFSTWDVDCRVTELDLKAARAFDALFDDWCGQQAGAVARVAGSPAGARPPGPDA